MIALYPKRAQIEELLKGSADHGDPVTAGLRVRFQQEVPGAKGQPHATIRGAGHFVQEDAGEELARIALELIARTPGA